LIAEKRMLGVLIRPIQLLANDVEIIEILRDV
jgi:hypothetical protein